MNPSPEEKRARRRRLQMKKVAKARKVLGPGLAVGAAFGIGMFIKNIINERRLERQEQLALEWTRQERLRRDAEFKQRDEQRRERERRTAAEMEERERDRLANDAERLREYNARYIASRDSAMALAAEREREFQEYIAERDSAMALAAAAEERRQAAIREVNERYEQRQQIVDTRNAVETKFVQENPPLPIQAVPECFGPDPISQEEVNLAENEDAVAVIYERGNPLRAHCFERGNFESWWSNANLYHSSKYAYDRNQPNSRYQIFRLYNDQTYITENSTKIIRENPAKVFQRVFFKKVVSGPDSLDLYVLIPVPVA